MEPKFYDGQRVTIIVSEKNEPSDVAFIGKSGVVYAYDFATTLYLIKVENGNTRAFYEVELEEESAVQQPSGDPHLQETKYGIRITHEWLGKVKDVEAIYEQRRLTLSINDKRVCLDEGETRYFLACMTTLYERGE